MKNGLEAFVAFILVILALVLLSLYSGFTLTLLWGWFIVPLFGVKALSVANAIGLSIFFSFFTKNIMKELKKANEDKMGFMEKLSSNVAEQFCLITSVMIVGWIVSWFV